MGKLISKKLTNITTNNNKPSGKFQGAFIMLFCGGVTTTNGLTAPPPKLL